MLRQRYGRTLVHALDSLAELRPRQVGPVSLATGDEPDGAKRDELVLRLLVGGRPYTTYNACRAAAELAPLLTALKVACPGVRVADTECDRPTSVDNERGMSPG